MAAQQKSPFEQRALIGRLLDYAERFADSNDEPAEGACRDSIRKGNAWFESGSAMIDIDSVGMELVEYVTKFADMNEEPADGDCRDVLRMALDPHVVKTRHPIAKDAQQTPPVPCEFQVGDSVTFTNDYGVAFRNMTVTGFSPAVDGGRCVYLDNDAWRFSSKPDSLTKTSEADLAGYIENERRLRAHVRAFEQSRLAGRDETGKGSVADANYRMTSYALGSRNPEQIRECLQAWDDHVELELELERRLEDAGQDVQIGAYNVKLRLDADGHLTFAVQSNDNTMVMDVGEDVALGDNEYAVRLTTEGIENACRNERSDAPRM